MIVIVMGNMFELDHGKCNNKDQGIFYGLLLCWNYIVFRGKFRNRLLGLDHVAILEKICHCYGQYVTVVSCKMLNQI